MQMFTKYEPFLCWFSAGEWKLDGTRASKTDRMYIRVLVWDSLQISLPLAPATTVDGGSVLITSIMIGYIKPCVVWKSIFQLQFSPALCTLEMESRIATRRNNGCPRMVTKWHTDTHIYIKMGKVRPRLGSMKAARSAWWW